MDAHIHIHEDDWGMRNLYPLAARPQISRLLDDAIEAGQRNRAPSGSGWTELHLIESPTISYVDAGLRLQQAATVLAPLMPRVRKFNATTGATIGSDRRDPFGSYEDDAWCFGFDEDCFIKLEPEGEQVERIWFDLRTGERARVEALRTAIEAIDALVPSVIADYFLDVEGEIRDPDFLADYFAAHAEIAARFEAQRNDTE